MDTISPEEALLKVQSGAFLVDVRTPAEYQEGHLNGAYLVNSEEIHSRISEFGNDLAREIVLYCKSGGRSGFVCDLLKAQGFTQVWNAGGYKTLRDVFDK